MRAVVITQYGGPEVLAVQERPPPAPKPGHVVIDVKAFGLNHAEIYFRSGAWGDVAEIIAAQAGAGVIATTRDVKRAAMLEALGAREVLVESTALSKRIRERHPGGIDAVLDIVGNTTVLDSLAALRRGGRVCLVGFLGGGGPLSLEPVFQVPSGTHLSVFASALVTGTEDFPLSEIPFQAIVDRVADGTYKAKPAKVFQFNEIQTAHRLMETNHAGGKLVVTL